MKPYNPHQKFKKKRSFIALIVVIALAAVFIVAGVSVALVERSEPVPQVTGMEFVSNKLGAYADYASVFVKVTFSDNTTKQVALSELMPTGIDKTKNGVQNIKLVFGNTEFVVPVDVVSTDLKVEYVTSGEGGMILGDLTQEVRAGENSTEVEAVAAEGYRFKNWSDNSTNPIRKELNVLKNTTLRAVFVKQEYIVTFLFADGTSREQRVQYGERADVIPETDSRLKKYGYRFIGWDTEEWKSVRGNITVKPVMESVKGAYDLYVSALKNEPMGTKKITDTNIETDSINGKNEFLGMSGTDYLYQGFYEWQKDGQILMTAATGRVFDCWEIYGSATQNGTPSYIKLYPGSSVQLWLPGAIESMRLNANDVPGTPTLSFRFAAGITLFGVKASFAQTNSNITFYSNGVVLNNRTVSLPFGQKLTAAQVSAPEDFVGYDFLGWYTDANVKIEENHLAFYVDTRLNANFKPKDIKVRFQQKDSTFISEKSAKYFANLSNTEIPSPSDIIFYRFIGWYVEACTDNPQLVGTAFSAETRLTFDITVRPKYERITYDMSVSISGQGKITYAAKDETTNLFGTEKQLGSYLAVEAGIEYRFTFEAESAKGYSLDSHKITYAGGGTSSGNGQTITVTPSSNFLLEVFYVPVNRTVTVENGVQGKTGKINVLGTEYNSQSFDVTVLNGMPLAITATAPTNMRILGIFVDSNSGLNKIPSGVFDTYTYNYDGGTGVVEGNIVITITYTQKTYDVDTVSGFGGTVEYFTLGDNGFEAVSGAATFGFGTKLKAVIKASFGKYISGLTIFGQSVDFYQYYSESYNDNLYEDGNRYFFTNRVVKGYAEKDKRVSEIMVYLPSPDKDADISISFEETRYNVEVVSSGFGTTQLDTNSVKEGGLVNLTMSTDQSYVILGYNITTHNSKTPTAVWVQVNDNVSLKRETIANIGADISLEVKFGRRAYDVLFYSLQENGISYSVTTDGEESIINNDKTKDYDVAHGDSKNFRLVSGAGYYLKEIRLVDGFENDILVGGVVDPTTRISLPINTDTYDLVLNKISFAYGVKVTLAKKSYDVKITTNAVSDAIGTLVLSAGGTDYAYDNTTSTFSFLYGTEVEVKATVTVDFRIALYSLDGVDQQVGDGSTLSVLINITKQTAVEIRFTFTGMSAESVILDKSLTENTANGTVTYTIKNNNTIILFTPVAKEGYVLRALYSNSTKLDKNEYGEYAAQLREGEFHYVSAVFEKKELQLALNAENGALSSEKSYVQYGETATVYVMASTGYELISVRLNGTVLADSRVAEIATAGYLILSAADTIGNFDSVTVAATFKAKVFTFSGSFDKDGTGSGKIILEDNREIASSTTEASSSDVRYGQRVSFRFEANAGSYISAIYLNGVAVELSSLSDAVIKTSNNKYSYGKFDVLITGDTTLSVRYDNDVFKVTTTQTAGGNTTMNVSLKGDNEYNSDETITLSMTAETGYHITGLFVNGVRQVLNFYSTEEPNLNISILYPLPQSLLVQNLVVRAEYERNTYTIKVSVTNESPNFKVSDNTADRFIDKIAMEYGGGNLDGKTETDRVNSRYMVTYKGIEHSGAPRATIQPKVSTGYILKQVLITYINASGRTETQDFVSYFTVNSGYSMMLPAMYGDITDFKVVVTRKIVTTKIPQSFIESSTNKVALKVEPKFYSVGAEIAKPAQAQAGDVYTYEYGVRAELKVTLTEGYTPTKFTLKMGTVTRDFVKDLNFVSGVATYATNLIDNSEFSYLATVTMVTLTLSRVGNGSGTFNFLVQGSPVAGVLEVVVAYGTTVGVSVIAKKELGSYVAAIRIDGIAQSLGNAENEVLYQAAVTGKATKNAAYEIELLILEYRFSIENVEGLQGASYNNDSQNIFPWGTERVNVRMELRQGYEVTSIRINEMDMGEGDYVVDGSIVTFVVTKISENKKIVPAIRKKTFTAAVTDSSAQASETRILKKVENGDPIVIANNVRNNISYGDTLYFEFRPGKNFYLNTYNLSMKDLGGISNEITLPETHPDAKNTDIIRVEIGLVTGDIFVETTYQRKVYTINLKDEITATGVGRIEIGQNQLSGGDGTIVTIHTNNITTPDGFKTYYGISSVKVNGYEYFRSNVDLTGWGQLNTRSYDSAQKTYKFEYRLDASDALMNGTNELIGSGKNFVLNLEVKIEKNLYNIEEIIVKNLENTPTSEKAYQIGNGVIDAEQFTGEFFDNIFDGSSDLINLSMVAGYSPIEVKVITDTGEKSLQTFPVNIGSQRVRVPASAEIANMTDPYRKTIKFIIIIDKNKYQTAFSVVTYEKNGVEVSVGSNTRGVVAKLNGVVVADSALTSISHGNIITLNAAESPEYDFAGYEMFDEISGTWIAAKNIVQDGQTIVYVDGKELTINIISTFRFRAVYYKKVAVDIVLAPWHKYISGNYVSGNGSDLNYVNYASLIVTVNGVAKRYEADQQNNDNGIFRYVFRYGDEALLEAKDTKLSQNASKKVTFYLQNNGQEKVMTATGAASQSQMRFIAQENYVYQQEVSLNSALYVAFDNEIKLNVGVETLGGKNEKDGAAFAYERKVSGAGNSYNSINLINGKTANVSMFDRIRITVNVADGYRFESFARYTARRNSANIEFLSSLEIFGRFKALGINDWDLDTDTTGLTSDSRFAITTKTVGAKKQIVVEFTVVDNSVYKFDFVKVFEASGIVSAPRYEGDGLNSTPVNVTVNAGNKSYFVSDATGVSGKLDYGASITIGLNLDGNELGDAEKWQFISWYANGVPVKAGGIRNFNYYDIYSDERIVLNNDYGFASKEPTESAVKFYAEFLPRYSIQSREYYKIGEIDFRPTAAFSMSGLYYDKTGGQVQISGKYSEAVNSGDGRVVTKNYLPFDAKKNGSGLPTSAQYINPIEFNVIVQNSYSIMEWRIYYGDYNEGSPNNQGGEVVASNQQRFDFTMTKTHFDKMSDPYQTITIVPIFNKQNVLNVAKSVFYNRYGEPTPTGRSDNNPGIVVGGYIEVISAVRIVNFGEEIILDANPNQAYRFIGWFNPGDPMSSTTPVYPNVQHRFTANKAGNIDYTFYLEARYIRTVTLTVSSFNASGSKVSSSAADILKGTAEEHNWMYEGIDVSQRYDASQLKSFAADNNGSEATATGDVGSYVLFKMSSVVNITRTFDPQYDKFYACIANRGNASITSTEDGDGWKMVAYLDQTKSISVQYLTYGELAVTGVLDQSVVTLGAKVSENLYERFGLNIYTSCFNAAEVLSAIYQNGFVTVTLNSTNTTGRFTIKGVKMANYTDDVLSFKFNLFDKVTDKWTETLGLNFSGDSVAVKQISKVVSTMPFASGAGTETNPYCIASYAQFRNLDVMYDKNGYDLQNIHFKQTATSITLAGSWIPMCANGDGTGFNGVLNGDNKKLLLPDNLESATMKTMGGIFAKTGIGTIRQYTLEMGVGATMRFSQIASDSGVVAGVANGTTFESLTFKNFNVTAYGNSFGLVAGTASGAKAKAISVTNFSLSFQKNDKGSVFGKAIDTVLEGIQFVKEAGSSAIMRFDTASYNIGGIVGTLSGTGSVLKNSTIKGGNIRATGTVGGAVGLLTEGATISNVAILHDNATQLLQVSAENIVAGSSGSAAPVFQNSENDSAAYAAGGLVGHVAKKSIVTGCYVKSTVTALMTVASPMTVRRNYPSVSVLASIAGGLAGVVGSEAMFSLNYIEQGTTVEILMPSRTDLVASSYAGGTDGNFGGLVASNFGTIYQCGINSSLYNNKNSFGLDQVGGNTGVETYSGDHLGKDSGAGTNPFEAQGGTNKGLHLNASVEFLYAVHTATASGGTESTLSRAVQNNYFYGATFMLAHSSATNPKYINAEYAVRGNSTAIMGGIVGFNKKIVNSCYVAGKVVHFRRHLTQQNGTIYSVLGGVVGYNSNFVYASGIIDSALYNYVKPVTDGNTQTVIVATGGVIGHNTDTVRGIFAKNTAVRSVNDPYSQIHNKSGSNSSSVFKGLSAGLVSSATGVSAGQFGFATDNKVSATFDTVGSHTGAQRIASTLGVNFGLNSATDMGGDGFAVYNNATLATIRNKTLVIGGATLSGSIFFTTEGPQLLDLNFGATGNHLPYRGLKGGYITL